MDEETNKEEIPTLEILNLPDFVEIKFNAKVFLRKDASEFTKFVKDSFSKNVKNFLINFNTCEYISSEGLGVVADFWRQCTETEGVRVASVFNEGTENNLLNFFEIIGLARVMGETIFTDYEKAKSFLTLT